MRTGWTRHAWALIASAKCPAVVYEPVFIDNPAHLDLCQAPELIGDALAAGLIRFLRAP
jgi:N-acetylmuramoyl-L-alanine amidase